jgi:predicted Rossmann fold nucleotide-binding protein DprA/Smf involved in DNA uptake
MLLNPPIDEFRQLQQDVRRLQEYIESVFTDYNDINENTRMQLELISQALAELQVQKRIDDKPRQRIGFRTSSSMT